MGNKAGKFNVPTTAAVNKDEAIINETDVKVEVQNGGANGDEIKHDSNNTEESAPAPKKKNMMSWLKKVSVRKEKKPKPPKENGVKDEVVEAPKENGDVEEANHVEETPAAEVVLNGHTEPSEDVKEVKNETVEVVEDTPIANGHENGVEATNSPVEEEH